MKDPSGTAARFPNHILCALDMEGRAGPAVIAAVWLAERLAAPLEIVHAFPSPLLWGKEEEMPEWIAGREETGQALRESLRRILARAPADLGLRTDAAQLRFHITAGHPVKVILEHARTSNADLIVIGPHEPRGWPDMGSTARGVLAHAPRGVWVQPGEPRPVQRILVPVDMSPDSLGALAVARDLAHVLDARVTVVLSFALPGFGSKTPRSAAAEPSHLIERLCREEQARFESAIAGFTWRGVPHEARFEQGEASDVVLALQDAHDLIVMGTHGRSGISAALLGSVAHAVLRSSRIPVLALRYPRRSFLF